MTKLEATMDELERVRAKCATSQVQLMEVIRANVQIEPMSFQSVEKEMTPMTNS